jgi:hypothetical protein
MASNSFTLAEQALISKAWERADSITAHLDGLMAATPRDEQDAPYDKYIPINQKRVKRIRKALAKKGLRDELGAVATALPRGVRMLVLNEFWCGDGAQILPVHEAVVLASQGTVEVRVLMRDDNLDVMDLFLTNGGRSIPKTVLLDQECQVLGTWGPRPEEAMDLVKRIKSDPAIAHTYSREVHRWYTQDATQATQAELAVLLGHAQRP